MSVQTKKNLYMVCMIIMCFVDHIKGMTIGEVQTAGENIVGLCIALIIFSAYQLKDFLKPVFYIWTGVFVLGFGIYSFFTVNPYTAYICHFTMGASIYVYVLLTIKVLMDLIKEKTYQKLNLKVAGAFALAMLLMFISKNASVWPLWFLFMFGCLYLCSFTKEDTELLFSGIVDGLILGFILIQSLSTLFRAYDEVRYTGFTCNSNANALFYIIIQAAMMGKWYMLESTQAPKYKRILAFIGSGIMLTYCILTIGKWALVVAMLDIAVISFFICRLKRKKFAHFMMYGAGIVLIGMISFPAIFGSIRYIPAKVGSPLVFASEHANSNKITGWVKTYDPRYVEMDEFLSALLGRFNFWKNKGIVNQTGAIGRIVDVVMPPVKAYASEIADAENPDTGSNPANAAAQESNPFAIRWKIHSSYLKKLNVLGHERNEGVQVTDIYTAPHAHNVFIEFSYNFGIIAGLLFLAFCILALFTLFRKCVAQGGCDWKYIVSFLFVFCFMTFGLFEKNWEVGQLAFYMFFFGIFMAVRKFEN